MKKINPTSVLNISELDTYLVGGAVRDTLLNRPILEKDYLVLGATRAQMIALGFEQVGRDFPVFLHPQTHEEYALARTERKQGQGYKGFVCYAEPDVTIEEDLLRRDLTVNAMAMTKNGEIIDPYHGQEDLKNKILRHVSPAFAEDPLRVLRVARFAARYHSYGFVIAPETKTLMTQISLSGELTALSAERVWTEIQRSLTEPHPEVFFTTLYECLALKTLWVDLHRLWGVPNPEKHHPEICSGIHTMMVLQQAVLLSAKTSIRFAALCHDLGKSLTPKQHWPSHRGHEIAGLALVESICQRLRVPNQHKSLALKVCQFHLHCHKAFELKASTILKLFDQLDLWRKPQEFEDFLITCEADYKGRLGSEHKVYLQAEYLQTLANAVTTITAQEFVAQGLTGININHALTTARLERLSILKAQLKHHC